MKKYLLILCLVCASGCGDFNFDMLSEKTASGATPVANAASDAITVIEDVADIEIISDATAAKGEDIASKVEQGAALGQAVTKIAAPFLGEYADTASGGLAALTALAVAAGAFFRKQRNTEKTMKEEALSDSDEHKALWLESDDEKDDAQIMTQTIMKAVDKLPGAGEAIKKEALENQIADKMEDCYKDMKAYE